MTTHTTQGRRPSPGPRHRPDDGDPGRDRAGDPWTDWSWPDAGWARATAPSPYPGSAADAAPTRGSEDTAAHRVVWADDADADDDPDPDPHPDLDPGRAGWLPLLGDDVVDVVDPRSRSAVDPAPGGAAAEEPGAPSRRRRRVVGALGALAALSVGFLGGVVADRVVGAPGDGTARLAGAVETDADGTLAVRSADGTLTAVRTSTGTRVVTASPVAGDLPPGTMVDVWTHRAPDGALDATAVSVRP